MDIKTNGTMKLYELERFGDYRVYLRLNDNSIVKAYLVTEKEDNKITWANGYYYSSARSYYTFDESYKGYKNKQLK